MIVTITKCASYECKDMLQNMYVKPGWDKACICNHVGEEVRVLSSSIMDSTYWDNSTGTRLFRKTTRYKCSCQCSLHTFFIIEEEISSSDIQPDEFLMKHARTTDMMKRLLGNQNADQ